MRALTVTVTVTVTGLNLDSRPAVPRAHGLHRVMGNDERGVGTDDAVRGGHIALATIDSASQPSSQP